jgi:SEC-C motif
MKKINKKIGRNDPCWCGSGKKYKKCHYGRDSMPEQNPFLAEKQLKKNFNKKYCLHPKANENECKGQIVKAHTVQKRGGLSRIAEKGHVMAFKPNMKSLIETGGKILPEAIGINQASTFTGFCEYHDDKTFELIEKYPFEAEPQQCFLLSYRALCKEIFNKKAALDSVDIYRDVDKGMPLEMQWEMQIIVRLNEESLKKSLQELTEKKYKYDEMLLSGDFRKFSYYGFFLDKLPEVLCSGGFAPEYDFNGALLQDYLNLEKDLESIYFSIVPFENVGVVIFGWIEDDGTSCLRFIKSLHELYVDSEIGNALIRFVFEFLENTFFKPSWWNALSAQEKDVLQKRMLSGAMEERKKDCLLDDSLRTVNWTVRSIFTNVDLRKI